MSGSTEKEEVKHGIVYYASDNETDDGEELRPCSPYKKRGFFKRLVYGNKYIHG